MHDSTVSMIVHEKNEEPELQQFYVICRNCYAICV